MSGLSRRTLLAVGWLPLAAAAVPLLARLQPPEEERLAEFATSLAGRSPAQRHNALWAARRLDGAVIAPGQTFSFNRQVGPWTRDAGVQRAPASFGGILVPSWGGGVCQVSTTLYCAALLAGLVVRERHPHELAPGYIPAGLDAAVAYGIADLRIENSLARPLRIRCTIGNEKLTCTLVAALRGDDRPRYRLVRELVASRLPPTLTAHRPQSGRPGVRVRLWRIEQTPDGPGRRELCHETEYSALPHTRTL